MKFKFEFNDEQTRLETSCTLNDMLTAITVEIKKIYESLDETPRKMFKEGIEQMVKVGICFMTDEEIKTNMAERSLQRFLEKISGNDGDVN